MNDIAIRVENLSKRYRIGVERHDTLRDALASFGRKNPQSAIRNPKSEEFWALRDVSFEVKRGEVVGVIGRNGAGKSTLLKILSRITEPTGGIAEIHGRVGSLLEVGTGFHPELTGRENIYLNGAILGMKRTEIARKFDEIVAFSEIEKFLDTPVKRYSSGMYVRLAFAVAAHLDPEILLVDEVLAVGDVAFQKKCLGKMGEVAGEGRTVLFVSHNMGVIADLCQTCVHIDEGMVAASGFAKTVIQHYLEVHTTMDHGYVDLSSWKIDRQGDGPMRVFNLSTFDDNGVLSSRFSFGETIVFRIGVRGQNRDGCIVGISIRDSTGRLILHLNNTDDRVDLSFPDSESYLFVRLPDNILNNGIYYVTIWLGDNLNILHDRVVNCLVFSVDDSANGSVRCQAPVRLRAQWLLRHKDEFVKDFRGTHV